MLKNRYRWTKKQLKKTGVPRKKPLISEDETNKFIRENKASRAAIDELEMISSKYEEDYF